jgi:quercetin dioxygenase-like cupin family protein
MIAMPFGTQWTLLVSWVHTEGRMAVIETSVRRGVEHPRHIHSREDELIYVLEGRVIFVRDGERFDGSPGSWILLPRGSEHTLCVVSPEARLLVILSPAGLEGFIHDMRQDDDAPESHEVERLVTIAARYGVTITGPGRLTAQDSLTHPSRIPA